MGSGKGVLLKTKVLNQTPPPHQETSKHTPSNKQNTSQTPNPTPPPKPHNSSDFKISSHREINKAGILIKCLESS